MKILFLRNHNSIHFHDAEQHQEEMSLWNTGEGGRRKRSLYLFAFTKHSHSGVSI